MSAEHAKAADFAETDRIGELILEPAAAASPDLEQERRIAVYDLLEDNRFALGAAGATGPFKLRFGAEGAMLRLVAEDAAGATALTLERRCEELSEAVADYVALCSDYRDAVKRLAPSQIEKIDEARRELHLESAGLLAERLAPETRMDAPTARRLFTVLCALIGDES